LYEKIFRNHAEDFIPLMIDGTVYAIDTDIDIINKDEELRIRELIENKTFCKGESS
jgi:hypothetical protein